MDLYQILGVEKNVSPEELKKAYRKLARQTHPDAGGNGDHFAVIASAYAVLRDKEKRKRYDETGLTVEVPSETLVARTQLLDMIMRLSEEPGDVLLKAQEHIRKGQAELNVETQQIEGMLRNLKDQLARFKYKGAEEDYITAALEYRIEQRKIALENTKKAKEQGDLVLKLLEEYSYQRPRSSVMPTQAFNSLYQGVMGGR